MEDNRKNRMIRMMIILVPLAVVCGALLVSVLGWMLGREKVADAPASYQQPSVNAPPAAAGNPDDDTPQSVAPPASLAEVPSSSSSEASSTGAPLDIPTPPGFSEAPTVSLSGGTATVTFKTTASSTVNTILTTNPEGISVGSFYDYYSRGQSLEGAVSKTAVIMVDPAGVSESYDLPDSGKSYYLLVNTVDNATGEWQKEVTVIPLRQG